MDLDNRIHTIRFSRFPTVDEVIEHVRQLNAKGVTRRLWIFEQCLDMNSAEVERLFEFFDSREPPKFPAKIALVSKLDSGFGISRMYATYAENPSTLYKPFRDEDEAIAWLEEE